MRAPDAARQQHRRQDEADQKHDDRKARQRAQADRQRPGRRLDQHRELHHPLSVHIGR